MNGFKTDFALRYLFAIALAIGIFFRFVNLDRKVYWYDETITSIRLAGYTKDDFSDRVTNGKVIQIQDLQKYQRQNSDKSLIDTIRSLAIENPEHPPLYYILARFWTQFFGDTRTATRSFSAAISLLAFGMIYWLCRELFTAEITAWVAIALLAVSPFHVLYSQEARGYSLLTVTTLLSSAAFLRAIRINKNGSWALYAVTVILGLYTSLLSVLVAIAHGIYLFVSDKFRLTKTFIAYIIASLFSFLAFFPWLFLMFAHFEDIDWIANKIPLQILLSRWLFNLSNIFFDIAIAYKEQFFDIKNGYDTIGLKLNEPLIYLTIPILILIGYAFYFLSRQTPLKVWLFIVILISTTTLPFLLKDLLSGGQRSSIPRYLIPAFLGIQLAVAYLIATKITQFNHDLNEQQQWRLITLGLISAGIVACAISSQAPTWWHKYSSYYNPPVAEIINQGNQPLAIASNAIRLTSLSYHLDPKVKLMLVKESDVPQIPKGFSDVFLFRPARTLQSGLEKKYRVELVHRAGDLWKINLK